MNVDRGYEIIQEVRSISFSPPIVTVYCSPRRALPECRWKAGFRLKGLDVEGFQNRSQVHPATLSSSWAREGLTCRSPVQEQSGVGDKVETGPRVRSLSACRQTD